MKLYKYQVLHNGKKRRPLFLGRRDDERAQAKIKWRFGTLAIYVKLVPVGYEEVATEG